MALWQDLAQYSQKRLEGIAHGAEDAEETKGSSWYVKHVESIIFQPAHSISAQCLDGSQLFSQRLHTKIFTYQSYKNLVRSGL